MCHDLCVYMLNVHWGELIYEPVVYFSPELTLYREQKVLWQNDAHLEQYFLLLTQCFHLNFTLVCIQLGLVMKLITGLPRNLEYWEDGFPRNVGLVFDAQQFYTSKQSFSPNSVGSQPKYAVTYANPCGILWEHGFTVDAKQEFIRQGSLIPNLIIEGHLLQKIWETLWHEVKLLVMSNIFCFFHNVFCPI